MKLILNKIKTEKKKKIKTIIKIKELENELVEFKKLKNPFLLESKLKNSNNFQVVDKNLHQIKNEILLDYTGEFEMIGRLSIADQIRATHNGFRNNPDYEAYFNAIDQDYKTEDAIFNGYFYKINTPQFNFVIRSEYEHSFDFKHEIFEYRGYKYFIPNKSYCFMKCVKYLTGGDYKEHYLDLNRNEKKRSNTMTQARIQPCCRNLGIDLGYYNHKEIRPRNITERKKALFLHNNHFCLIWKSKKLVSIKVLKELKDNIKKVDNFIIEENVNSRFKYAFLPKKIESHQLIL